MAKIPSQQKLDNYRNMCSMVSDYEKLYHRWPTIQELEEKLGMSPATVKRYKRDILMYSKRKLLDSYQYDIVVHVREALNTINRNISIFEEIRDSPETDSSGRMAAAKLVLETHLDAIRIMEQSPEYLGPQHGDYDVQDGQEHIHGKGGSEKVKEFIEATFDRIDTERP
jgi:transcriptional regulator with XRE-family HTH domain